MSRLFIGAPGFVAGGGGDHHRVALDAAGVVIERGVPPGLPFCLDLATLRRGLNITLTTTLGPIDLGLERVRGIRGARQA